MGTLRCHIDTTYIDKFGNSITSWRSIPGNLKKGIENVMENFAYEDRDLLCVDLEVKEGY